MPDDNEDQSFLISYREGVDAFPWHLDTIGDLIDDLRIVWRSGHVFGRHDPWDVPHVPITAGEAETEVEKHQAVEQRLRFEAEQMAP